MTVNDMAALLEPIESVFPPEIGRLEIKKISADGRDREKASVFFAYKGETYDSGPDAAEVYKSGRAGLIVCEKYPGPGIPCMLVKDGRKALSKTLSAFYGDPLKNYVSAAVTGTNGKTTSVYLLDSIFKAAGMKTLRIGTTGIDIAGRFKETKNTTPSPFTVFGALKEGLAAGAKALSMEVSSHALSQGRLEGARFGVSVFTNLTGDHLDFHKDMESYFEAKASLFTEGMSLKKVINITCPYGKRLARRIREGLITYGARGEADIFPLKYDFSIDGVKADISIFGKSIEITSPLIGEYNLENILGSAGAAYALDIPEEYIVKGIKALKNVPGRLEKFQARGVTVFVDYAHTDDALRNVLSALRKVTKGRLLTVFGAGGDRDRTKRPRMGAVVSELSDKIIVTSDNPRTEDPAKIIEDILQGVKPDFQDISAEEDREKAIARAICDGKSGDAILIAGKGHEDYQIVGNEKRPFDDGEMVKKYLGRAG